MMADRTSAYLFGEIFKELAKDEPIDRAAFARRLWKMAGDFDFAWYQMYCDEALIKLGLAHRPADGHEADIEYDGA
jgi:hypothetical protein